MRTQTPSHDEIARRAYQIYQQRGCQPGHELEDWLEAKNQLSAKPEAEARRPVSARKKPARLSTTELEEVTNPWEHALPRRPGATSSM